MLTPYTVYSRLISSHIHVQIILSSSLVYRVISASSHRLQLIDINVLVLIKNIYRCDKVNVFKDIYIVSQYHMYNKLSSGWLPRSERLFPDNSVVNAGQEMLTISGRPDCFLWWVNDFTHSLYIYADFCQSLQIVYGLMTGLVWLRCLTFYFPTMASCLAVNMVSYWHG